MADLLNSRRELQNKNAENSHLDNSNIDEQNHNSHITFDRVCDWWMGYINVFLSGQVYSMNNLKKKIKFALFDLGIRIFL